MIKLIPNLYDLHTLLFPKLYIETNNEPDHQWNSARGRQLYVTTQKLL